MLDCMVRIACVVIIMLSCAPDPITDVEDIRPAKRPRRSFSTSPTRSIKHVASSPVHSDVFPLEKVKKSSASMVSWLLIYGFEYCCVP